LTVNSMFYTNVKKAVTPFQHKRGEKLVHPMVALWHLSHMDVGNVSRMSRTSLTMPSQHF
jgi:hypothetical protein